MWTSRCIRVELRTMNCNGLASPGIPEVWANGLVQMVQWLAVKLCIQASLLHRRAKALSSVLTFKRAQSTGLSARGEGGAFKACVRLETGTSSRGNRTQDNPIESLQWIGARLRATSWHLYLDGHSWNRPQVPYLALHHAGCACILRCSCSCVSVTLWGWHTTSRIVLRCLMP